ncbi:bifunctional 4-hydroxy-2-oxoglutarate aldolase/2-dehydro-3-deoxy-phosphogluconate aldolase [Bradyrhizobium sp. SSUT18]|uniref:bifunctional 4-hydroxy-2-oxoglutarate aldolase/2-dehydro-3-deoxy-phosphogluconate aldolase n=1 Tax=Bradyrhizobium sp. SSUT18 TaxID=3040602 RepID=UPI0024475FBB|nr:bifunctional 4-hydroxy-2-oxoglutarate aldolase/2-dehydro-3-deoxy-phosphogluconate aldolase [Bradyrhizobium sp. SSUT18]MDH2406633.1 bifunctional 4-hydroxy-2-oxoglutarate aldolase/2-dehydro-3-deoxy-phosphogluconate aldolase [Bradyrhizobium sp. SSUT18]
MSMRTGQQTLGQILAHAPVIPVVVIDNPAHARPLGIALLRGGLKVIEVTLRTSAAFEAIREMAALEGAIVGAGTVLNARQIQEARHAGARFAVSPGMTETLLDASADEDIPMLAGAASASEAMQLIEWGAGYAKFFPAEAAGGANMLKAWASPLPQLKFCPTGGITPENARRYLDLPNVICVGGSWMVLPALLREENWHEVERLSREAASL